MMLCWFRLLNRGNGQGFSCILRQLYEAREPNRIIDCFKKTRMDVNQIILSSKLLIFNQIIHYPKP